MERRLDAGNGNTGGNGEGHGWREIDGRLARNRMKIFCTHCDENHAADRKSREQ